MKERKTWVNKRPANMSLRHACSVLSVNRSQQYYQPICSSEKDMHDVTLMNEIQDIYAMRPFQGYKRITYDLKDLKYGVNHKRVYRLMRLMGLHAVYPKKNLSKRRLEDSVYPYLLKQHPPKKVHDCWCVDITYIKTSRGHLYLTALIDVVSRYVVGWSVNTCLDTSGCLDALEMAYQKGFAPKIINSDQGCQFTSQEWAYSLSLLQIRISMNGKGRCLFNIPIKRFWRTLKVEEVYLNTYETVAESRAAISNYIDWYNHKRRHSGIDNHRPVEVVMGLKYPSYWPFKESTEFKQQQDITPKTLSSSLAA
jgi:putative transposase